jgi:hypothetical protein
LTMHEDRLQQSTMNGLIDAKRTIDVPATNVEKRGLTATNCQFIYLTRCWIGLCARNYIPKAGMHVT